MRFGFCGFKGLLVQGASSKQLFLPRISQESQTPLYRTASDSLHVGSRWNAWPDFRSSRLSGRIVSQHRGMRLRAGSRNLIQKGSKAKKGIASGVGTADVQHMWSWWPLGLVSFLWRRTNFYVAHNWYPALLRVALTFRLQQTKCTSS